MEEKSCLGHGLSIRRPLRIVPVGEDLYSCDGLPADCIILACEFFCSSQGWRPDLVLSGINHGANLGQDIYYSGTVAAAREAAFQGIRSMAISLSLSKDDKNQGHFQTAADVVEKLLSQNIHQKIKNMNILNINVPNIPFNELKGIQVTNLSFRNYSDSVKKCLDSQGRECYRIDGGYRGFISSGPNPDCQAIELGKVSITPLTLLPSLSQEKFKDFIASDFLSIEK